jgi:CBS domain-containing membrane protein
MKKPDADLPRVKFRWSRYHAMLIATPDDGATRDRMIAGLGALVAIAAIGLLLRSLAAHAQVPLLIAPMGAAAVLLFAVPASPMAQPRAVIGGNIVSALVGIAVARLLPDPMIAAGVAVAAAIIAMVALRCLHPPGGAVALTAIFGGHDVAAAGYGFALMPVAIDALLLTAAAWGFHRFSGHSYPHVARPAAPAPTDHFSRADLRRAIADYPDRLDVDPDDLEALLHVAEHHAAERQKTPQRRA